MFAVTLTLSNARYYVRNVPNHSHAIAIRKRIVADCSNTNLMFIDFTDDVTVLRTAIVSIEIDQVEDDYE